MSIYIEEASFWGLTMRSSVLETYPTRWGWKGRRDRTIRWERCIHPPENAFPWIPLLCVNVSCNYWCSSYEGRHKIYQLFCRAARPQTLDNLIFTLVSKGKPSSWTSPTLITSVGHDVCDLFFHWREAGSECDPPDASSSWVWWLCCYWGLEIGSESAAEPLHSVGDSAAIVESAVEPLQSAVDAPTETSCS
jgi:hypothetical protein